MERVRTADLPSRFFCGDWCSDVEHQCHFLYCDIFNERMWIGRNILNNQRLRGSCCHKMEPVSRMHNYNHFVSENRKH